MVSPSKRILITGIEGFTGRWLETILSEAGYEVWGSTLHRDHAPRHLSCDLRDAPSVARLLSQIQPDYVLHLAGLAHTALHHRLDYYAVNTLASENLLKAIGNLPKAPKKTILASSAVVYGPQERSVLDETLCPRPVGHYGLSKLAMEQIAEFWSKRLPLIVTRPFNYTGPGQEESFVVPKIVAHFCRKAPRIELGNLEVKREFNDVRYVAECYRRLLESQECGVVNLCSGRPVSLKEVLAAMEKITGRNMQIAVNPKFVRKDEIPTLCGSTDKLRQMIELPSPMALEETLRWMYGACA